LFLHYKLITDYIYVTDILKVLFHYVLSLFPLLLSLFLSLSDSYMEKFLYSENASARSKRSGFLIVNQSTLNAICKYWNLFYISIRAYACISRACRWHWLMLKDLERFTKFSYRITILSVTEVKSLKLRQLIPSWTELLSLINFFFLFLSERCHLFICINFCVPCFHFSSEILIRFFLSA